MGAGEKMRCLQGLAAPCLVAALGLAIGLREGGGRCALFLALALGVLAVLCAAVLKQSRVLCLGLAGPEQALTSRFESVSPASAARAPSRRGSEGAIAAADEHLVSPWAGVGFSEEPLAEESEGALPASADKLAYLGDERTRYVRFALGCGLGCGVGVCAPEPLALAPGWQARVVASVLSSSGLQVLSADSRCYSCTPSPSATPGSSSSGGLDGLADAFASSATGMAALGASYTYDAEDCFQPRRPSRSGGSQDVLVLMSVLVKLDVDSACDTGDMGDDSADPDEALKQLLLKRLGGGGVALPGRVVAALIGRDLDAEYDDGCLVTVQADSVLFLEYMYSAIARAWLPLHCMPTDPLCLPAPPPLGAVSDGRLCVVQLEVVPCVHVAPPGATRTFAVCVDEYRSPVLDVWPDTVLSSEPMRLAVHVYGSSGDGAPAAAASSAQAAAPVAAAAAGASERGAADGAAAAAAAATTGAVAVVEVPLSQEAELGPECEIPGFPFGMQRLRRWGAVSITVPPPPPGAAATAAVVPYAGLLAVEVWRGRMLCGVGHALALEAAAPGSAAAALAADAAALAARVAAAQPAPVSPIVTSAALPPVLGGAAACDGGGPFSRASYATTEHRRYSSDGDDATSLSREYAAEHVLSQLRCEADAPVGADDPRNLLLQDLGLFLVHAHAATAGGGAGGGGAAATAPAAAPLPPAFLPARSQRGRVAVHEAIMRGGLRVLDAAVEGGCGALAAALRAHLRSLGASDKVLLLGGVQRPAGLPLLHLAMLSGRPQQARQVLEWCREAASCGLKDWARPVHVVSPSMASAGAARVPEGRRLSRMHADGALPYATTVIDPQQLAPALGLQALLADMVGAHAH